MDTQPAKPGRKRWPSPWVVLGFAVLCVVTLPFTILLLASLQYSLFPVCYGGSTEYTSGEHLGFSVGMQRDDALITLNRQGALKSGFAVYDPNSADIGRSYRFPRNFEELRAIKLSSEVWAFKRSGSLCLMSYRATRLTFNHGRLAKIEDELAYNGP